MRHQEPSQLWIEIPARLNRSIEINVQSCGLYLAREQYPPIPIGIKRDVHYARYITDYLDTIFVNCTNVLTTKSTDEVSKFENYILTRSNLIAIRICFTKATPVVTRQKDYSKRNIRVVGKFLDNRSATVRLFMQNYHL